MKGTRADIRLVELGLAESREKARSLIMSGAVSLSGIRVEKPGDNVPTDSVLTVKENPIPFVSRGGLKLDKPVRKFGISLAGAVALDIGASTGGFTDCMLQNGAKKVYAIDVGYGQLAWKLRTDERVVNLERTNFRYVTAEQIPEPLDFASVDVSFISLSIILPVLSERMKPSGWAVCLVKPQFEAGREKVGKKGVVRDPAVHIEVVERIVGKALEAGFSTLGLTYSPIKGPEGNIEYLLFLEKSDSPQNQCPTAEHVVNESHAALDRPENDEGKDAQ